MRDDFLLWPKWQAGILPMAFDDFVCPKSLTADSRGAHD